MKGINEVKKDLRELKKHVHALRRLEVACKTHEMRIKLLSTLKQTERTRELIRVERELIQAIDIGGAFDSAQRLELYYIDKINKLCPTDKSIMVDAFLNGVPYWKIGIDLGFSEETIRKRVDRITGQIAKMT